MIDRIDVNPEAMQLKYKEARKESSWVGVSGVTLSRRDRSPCPRQTPQPLQRVVSILCVPEGVSATQVGRRRTLLLLLLSGLLSGTTSGGTTGNGGSSATAGADVDEQVLDVLTLKSL